MCQLFNLAQIITFNDLDWIGFIVKKLPSDLLNCDESVKQKLTVTFVAEWNES